MADITDLITEARSAHDEDLRRLEAPVWRPLKRRRAKQLVAFFGRLEDLEDPVTDGKSVG